MTSLGPRPIRRLLIANRGEIATRIMSSARELGIETIAVYTDNDVGHTYNASETTRLSAPSAYLDISELIGIVQKCRIDAVHPGYGFLSESADFARRVRDETDAIVVGPGPEILGRTGDKLQARLLAEECSVPVLPALTTPTGKVEDVQRFAQKAGFPLMVKAVDGGGGRGIRLIQSPEDLAGHFRRAIEESPSKSVFAEKAAVNGFRHVEVQIVGDGRGNIMHLWERECSIQRRYQKVVELAPSTISNRKVVARVVECAVRMAKKINYASLGTFEFLLNPSSSEFYFLEINPRLQVEHTITESICGVDIVKAQLRLAQGASLQDSGLDEIPQDPKQPPNMHSIQLRITAEDPEKNWSLSIGKIQSFHFPSGNGIRVDTALVNGAPAVVSADFDSVIAKLIITARCWEDVVRKARRAIADTRILGVKTNLSIIRAIIAHPDFLDGACDTQWLEVHQEELIAQSKQLPSEDPFHGLVNTHATASSSVAISTSSTLFRKDDAWSINLSPQTSTPSKLTQQQPHHLQVSKILRNNFPSSFAADILFTIPGSSPRRYTMSVTTTGASASALSSQHRQGNPGNPTHIIVPFSGKLVEVLVDSGNMVKKGDVICVIKQMKMELEVRSHKSGLCTWITEADDDEDVAEGMLAAVIEDERVDAKL